MKIFTIGFTKSSAKSFFGRIQKSGAKRVVDVRLKNMSQLAGFAKKDDLEYFLKAICDIGYAHRAELAPTNEMLDAYRKHGGDWIDYERRFVDLITNRQIELTVPPELLDGACLLCSEDKPHRCHRRLVAEYLKGKWSNVEIDHL